MLKLLQQFNLNNTELEQAIQDNYGLIVSRACSFCSKSKTELEDYIQVAVLAFIKSYDKFDKKKATFSTYMSSCINNAIFDYIGKNKKHSFRPIKKSTSGLSSEQFWELLPDNLTSIEKSIVMLKLEAYTKTEIALILDCSQKEVSDNFKRAKNKIRVANTDEV
jgi:RNA polymerase sigma factor (sigma-70 family)